MAMAAIGVTIEEIMATAITTITVVGGAIVITVTIINTVINIVEATANMLGTKVIDRTIDGRFTVKRGSIVNMYRLDDTPQFPDMVIIQRLR